MSGPSNTSASLSLLLSLPGRSWSLRPEADERPVLQLHQRFASCGGHGPHHQRHAADHAVPDHRHGNRFLSELFTLCVFMLRYVFPLRQDERNQILTTYLWVRQVWMDAYLTWKKEDYDGLDTIRIPSSYVWRPDIVLYNR